MSVFSTSLTSEINQSFELLGPDITLNSVLWAGAVLVAAFVFDKFTDRLIQRAVENRGGDQHAAVTAKKISS